MAIQDEIDAFNRIRTKLEADHMGKWVLVREAALVGTYETFDQAAADAVRRFGSGPYLIRQVGAPPITLPVSVMFQPHHARR